MRMNDVLDVSKNIGEKERVLSIVGGSFLLFNALAKKDKSLTKALAAGYLLYRGTTGHCPVNSAIGIHEVEMQDDVHIKTSLTIDKPRSQVYDFWRRLENLPTFMDHLKKVTALNNETSEWEAKLPGGVGTVSWISEIVEEIPGEFISWQSLPGSTIENVGNIYFRDAGQYSTVVDVDITYRAPMGTPGNRLARLFNPLLETLVKEDIKDFKRILETGEIPTIDGQPSGNDSL